MALLGQTFSYGFSPWVATIDFCWFSQFEIELVKQDELEFYKVEGPWAQVSAVQ